MILFRPEHVDMILQGKKTATRRMWGRPRVKVGAVHKCKLNMFTDEHFAKIKILSLYRQRLGDMNDQDYRKEGYSRQGFKSIWRKLHRQYYASTEVWVVEFMVVP